MNNPRGRNRRPFPQVFSSTPQSSSRERIHREHPAQRFDGNNGPPRQVDHRFRAKDNDQANYLHQVRKTPIQPFKTKIRNDRPLIQHLKINAREVGHASLPNRSEMQNRSQIRDGSRSEPMLRNLGCAFKSQPSSSKQAIPDGNESGNLRRRSNYPLSADVKQDRIWKTNLRSSNPGISNRFHGVRRSAAEVKNAQVPFVDDPKTEEVEPMEIDEIEVVCELRHDFRGWNRFKTPLGETIPEIDLVETHKTYRKKIFIVVDTCALLTNKNLAVINKLFDCNLKGVGYPYLCIPWIVLQELDFLKSNHNEDIRLAAVKAIKLLNDLLIKKHPRLLGQSAKMAKDFRFAVDTNDDSILNFCLQCQDKCPNDVVALLTNDNNLCSKAIISTIICYSTDNIFDKLANISEEMLVPRKSQPKPPSSVLNDDLISEIKSEMCDVLTNLIETECTDVYGTLWAKVMPVEPPWDLKNCFFIINKLWLAVFTFLFSRKDCEKFIKLEQFLKKGYSNDRKEIKEMLSTFLSCLQNYHPSTDIQSFKSSISNSLLKLRALQDQCKSPEKRALLKIPPSSAPEHCESSISPQIIAKRGILPDPSNVPQQRSSQTPVVANQQSEVSRSFADNYGYNVVERGLDVVWEQIHLSCGLILDGLNIGNSFEYIKQPELPTVDQVFSFLPKIYPAVQNLRKSLSKVLSEEGSTASCLEFHSRLVDFHTDIGMNKCMEIEAIEPVIITKYCQNKDKRKLLSEGLDRLNQYRAILQSCIVQIGDKIVAVNNGF